MAIHVAEEDIEYEKELLRNPYSVRHWLRYIGQRKASVLESNAITELSQVPHANPIYSLYERALLEMPMSYKLWHQYLKLRLEALAPVCPAAPVCETLNNTFERCLVFMHRMPRIWTMYGEWLVKQRKITRTRRVLDRALCALPITQHGRVWAVYVDFISMHKIPETALRVWKRYLKFASGETEEYIDFLIAEGKLAEAAKKLEWCVNTESFVSKRGKSKYQLWSELCDLLSNNPQETSLHNAEAIIRHGLQRYTDQTGRLWNCLARYYVNSALFERARDVFEEAVRSVVTVRDFSQVFDAYALFEEQLLNADVKAGKQTETEYEWHLTRLEDLYVRRPLLQNSVNLRQNPHNVLEWQARVKLYAGKPKMQILTYTEAVKTINPKLASGKLWHLWRDFAMFYEDAGQLSDARLIFLRGTQVAYVRVDDLASLWCEAVEMEIRHDNTEKALEVLKRATASPGVAISYHDEKESVQRRVHKSLKLWSLYADIEESVGTFQSCKAVYDRIIDLRIATPQTIINYAMFLQDHQYFEESFKAYERGISLFRWPYVYDLWKTYLAKFLERYRGTKLERARDLFEQCLDQCPAKYCGEIYRLYAGMEEEHGLARHVRRVLSEATKKVPPEEKLEMYNVYLRHADSALGIVGTREIYQEAIEELPDHGARQMCLRFAAAERAMGEIDRAREIYAHGSQICDPRTTQEYWAAWKEFEVQHGNEDTMKELLRIQRSMAAKFNTQVNQVVGVLPPAPAPPTTPGDSMQQLEARAAAPSDAPPSQAAPANPDGARIMFVRGDASARDIEVADAARVANPDRIDIGGDSDSDDEEEEEAEEEVELPTTKEVPQEVFGSLKNA